MNLWAYFTWIYHLIRQVWLPPRPQQDAEVELAPSDEEGDTVPLSVVLTRPVDGNIELHQDTPVNGSRRYKLLVALRPGDYASTGGQTVLSLHSRSASGTDPPLTALTLHYMLRPTITILPGRGAEYTLYCIPVSDPRVPRYEVSGPLTRITVWNLAVERDPLGSPLEWVAVVNGTHPERWTYTDGMLNIEGFEADLNGMITITLTAT